MFAFCFHVADRSAVSALHGSLTNRWQDSYFEGNFNVGLRPGV